MIQFTVLSEPKPKGSFRAYTYHRKAEKGGGIGARATNANKGTTSWQSRVAFEATCALRGVTLELAGAISLQVEFFLRRPKKLSKREAANHLKKPDLDKLLRAVMDALSGVVWKDDSQVTTVITGKAYAAVGDQPRAVITVKPIAIAAADLPLLEKRPA